MIIYKIKNKINGKIYIGQTMYSLERRIVTHLNANFHIGKALRKYGLQSFITSIIDEAHIREVLNEKEKYWIGFYDCKVPRGYNFTDGGDGIDGYNHTEETKKKIGLGNKDKPSWRKGTGKIKSNPQSCLCGCGDITKAGNKYITGHNTRGIPPSNKGKHHSEETKQKIGQANAGRHHSEEARQKIGDGNRGKILSMKIKEKMKSSWVIRKQRMAGCASGI